jgi:hypothetical protein
MIGHNVLEILKPEQGKLGQNRALVGDGIIHDHVKGGDSIRGHHQQMVAHLVEVTDLAAMQQLEIGKIRLGYGGCHGIFLIKKITADAAVAGMRMPDAFEKGYLFPAACAMFF